MIPKPNKITLLLGQTPLSLLTRNEAQAQIIEQAYVAWWVLDSAIKLSSCLTLVNTINVFLIGATITYDISLPKIPSLC